MFTAFDINVLDPQVDRTSSAEVVEFANALTRAGARVRLVSGEDRQGTAECELVASKSWGAVCAQLPPHDVCIIRDGHKLLSHTTNARINFLWETLEPSRHTAMNLRRVLWNIDGVAFNADRSSEFYDGVFGKESRVALFSANPPGLFCLKQLQPREVVSDNKKLVYTARSEAALRLLLEAVAPRVLGRDEAFTFYVTAVDGPSLESCARLCRGSRLGKSVVWLGALPAAELSAHYATARLSIEILLDPGLNQSRPTHLETMYRKAAGLPVVTAIAPVVAVTGPGRASEASERWALELTQQIVDLASVDDRYAVERAAALADAKEYQWSAVAEHWISKIHSTIHDRNDLHSRRVFHFRRHGDRAALRALGVHECVATETGRPDVAAAQDVRVILRQLLQDTNPTAEFPSLLIDYRCNDETFARLIAQAADGVRVLGLRRQPESSGSELRVAAHAGTVERVSFQSCGAYSANRAADCVVLRNVIENEAEPWLIVQEAEQLVRAGGRMYLTASTGLEQAGPREWCLDAHDLRDMFGDKPDLLIRCERDELSEPAHQRGWRWLVSYSVDHMPVRPIDVERHLWLQSPEQMISAAIIAGPGSEETLHWMLSSVQDVVDEIVIADCGMSPEAHTISDQYGVCRVDGIDPREVGFDVARNLALEACSGEWCLWVDTDEHLVGGAALRKYLRCNGLTGYAVKQHNFACDMVTPPDAPVRLFRCGRGSSKQVRFWGAIHEHPEIELNKGIPDILELPDVHLAHVGYLLESRRRQKFYRNWPLLELDSKLNPERLLQKHFLMRENVNAARFALERSGGQVDEEILDRCKQTIVLYREYFLGVGTATARESLEYYSEAATIAGIGFDAVIAISASTAEAPAVPSRNVRFASVSDYLVELKQQACTELDARGLHREV